MDAKQHLRPSEDKCVPVWFGPKGMEPQEYVTKEWHDYWTGRLEEQHESLRRAVSGYIDADARYQRRIDTGPLQEALGV